MASDLDQEVEEAAQPVSPRRSARHTVQAEVHLRRCGQLNYRVTVHNLSREGCQLEFVERPNLNERVWVKFDHLDALESRVCWSRGFVAGLEFVRPVHIAVFEKVLDRIAK